VTQSQLLQFAVETLERLEIEYALVGSLASSTLGEARFTNDIDIVVKLDVFDAARLCDAFSGDEFSVYKPAVIQEVESGRQFNILHPTSSNKIDFMLVGDTKWSRGQLERRVRRDVLDAGACYVAAAEDIILGKLLYYQDGGSEKHIRDITGIMTRSRESIDRNYLDQTAVELGVDEEWQSILKKLADIV
jgi:hypothetical protein